jgi:hypothetical protein
MATQDYLNLLTSEHQGQPNLAATISAPVSMCVQIQSLLTSIDTLLDIGLAPVGHQLDMIGACVGASRYLQIPIAGAFFTWDDLTADGWDSGTWQSASLPSVLTVLPDDIFLKLIRAKIAANNWDGTTEGAYAAWAILLPGLNMLIQDYQNMSFTVAIQGAPLDIVTRTLLTRGILPLRPEGVLINEYIVPVDTNSLFGWDLAIPSVQGWDTGSWGIEIAPS